MSSARNSALGRCTAIRSRSATEARHAGSDQGNDRKDRWSGPPLPILGPSAGVRPRLSSREPPMISDPTTSLTGIHLMAKPVGALCNLDCGYCFYLEKESQYPARHRFRMQDDVLEAYVKRYIAAVHAPVVEFTWQGGEPTLIGLDFFGRAVALQRLHAGGKQIANTLQTNG